MSMVFEDDIVLGIEEEDIALGIEEDDIALGIAFLGE